MTKKIDPKFLDQAFDGVEIPDDKTVARQTGHAKRLLKGWYEKHIQRSKDPEYRKKISDSLRGLKRENTEAYKRAAQNRDPELVKQQQERLRKLGQDKEVRQRAIESRRKNGNLTHSEETRQKISEKSRGRPAPNKGQAMSEEQKLKLSQAHKGKKLDTGKSVTTPLGVFERMKDAAQAHGMTYPRLAAWVKDPSKPEFHFTGEKKEFKPKQRKSPNLGAIQTPIGVFASKKHAYEAYEQRGESNAKNKMSKWLKERPEEFYYID